MEIRRILTRGISGLMLVTGVGIYAVQSGFLPQFGADAAPEPAPAPAQVAAAAPVPAAPVPAAPTAATADVTRGPVTLAAAPIAPNLPATDDGSDVRLPAQSPVVEASLTEPGNLPTPQPAPMPYEAAPTDTVEVSPFGLPCDITLTATPQPGAMVALDLLAPCQGDARIVIEHSGLTLTGQTDALGLMTLDIPAFETPAFFMVKLPDGAEATAIATVTDLADFDRVGVTWAGAGDLQLHAMPSGTAFGADGHIWEEAPGSMDQAIAGENGAITLLGDASVDRPMVAQVFTYPHAALSDGETIALSIDAPVTEANCGRPVDALTLETSRASAVQVTPLTFTVPGCDAIGDFLVLQNLLRDLTVAQN